MINTSELLNERSKTGRIHEYLHHVTSSISSMQSNTQDFNSKYSLNIFQHTIYIRYLTRAETKSHQGLKAFNLSALNLTTSRENRTLKLLRYAKAIINSIFQTKVGLHKPKRRLWRLSRAQCACKVQSKFPHASDAMMESIVDMRNLCKTAQTNCECGLICFEANRSMLPV